MICAWPISIPFSFSFSHAPDHPFPSVIHRPAPAPPLHASRASQGSVAATELTDYKELETHKKGLFRKKVSIATMLSWSKASLEAEV